MEIIAYDSTIDNPPPIVLGSPIQEFWVNGFRSGQKRTIQMSRPINAARPNLFDRITSEDSDGFAAQRTFTGEDALQQAVLFYRTHKTKVPRLAHVEFREGDQSVWQRNCAITDVNLVKLNGATVGFSYNIVGGEASLT